MVFALVKESDGVLILPTGYIRNGFTPLNNSCPYHNYCSNCNGVWKAEWKRGGKETYLLSLFWDAFYYLREGVVISSFSYILIIFIIKMITRVAWKANKVSDGLHLLDLIKNRGQLNCRAVVLCWPVIALETGDDIVGGTTAGIAVQFLPNKVYPLSVDFANFLSKLFYLNRGVLNILLLTVQYRRHRAQISLSPSVCFCGLF